VQELVKLVVDKTGLPEAAAQLAVQTVLQYLKDKLPAPLASQIDAAVSGGGGADLGGLGQAANIAKGLGGLFDK